MAAELPKFSVENALVMCGSSLEEVAGIRLPMLSNTSVQVTATRPQFRCPALCSSVHGRAQVHYATSGTEIATFELEPTQSAQVAVV